MVNLNKIILNEIRLIEYLTKEGVSLLKYFRLSEMEKREHLPRMYYYLFEDFINENDIDFEKPDDYDDYDLIDWLYDNNRDIYNLFSVYLYAGINNNTLSIPEYDYPAWAFFSSPKLIKNQWLIHQTNDAHSIANNGFIYGVYDIDKLGLTTMLGEFEKKYGGYNFSYTLLDFLKYGKSDWGSQYRYKYGKEAVVFRASGIRLWHYGDEEYQTIFYGNTAKNIIPITYSEYSGNYIINSVNNNQKLVESEDMETAVKWIIKNYEQYRKQLHK